MQLQVGYYGNKGTAAVSDVLYDLFKNTKSDDIQPMKGKSHVMTYRKMMILMFTFSSFGIYSRCSCARVHITFSDG